MQTAAHPPSFVADGPRPDSSKLYVQHGLAAVDSISAQGATKEVVGEQERSEKEAGSSPAASATMAAAAAATAAKATAAAAAADDGARCMILQMTQAAIEEAEHIEGEADKDGPPPGRAGAAWAGGGVTQPAAEMCAQDRPGTLPKSHYRKYESKCSLPDHIRPVVHTSFQAATTDQSSHSNVL